MKYEISHTHSNCRFIFSKYSNDCNKYYLILTFKKFERFMTFNRLPVQFTESCNRHTKDRKRLIIFYLNEKRKTSRCQVQLFTV